METPKLSAATRRRLARAEDALILAKRIAVQELRPLLVEMGLDTGNTVRLVKGGNYLLTKEPSILWSGGKAEVYLQLRRHYKDGTLANSYRFGVQPEGVKFVVDIDPPSP